MATEIVRKSEMHLIESSFAKCRVRMVDMYVERRGFNQYEANLSTCVFVVFLFEGGKLSTVNAWEENLTMDITSVIIVFMAIAMKYEGNSAA